jgi:TRAP-type mannitol/chloroaromatic compound transport system permease large subunit
MADPQVALLMLGLLIFAILLGFPIAFTLMAIGLGFGATTPTTTPLALKPSSIFRGCMPFLLMVFVAMELMHALPGLALWLSEYFYDK